MADNKNVSYLLIGSGQLAKHLQHWLRLRNCHVLTWDRAQDPHLLTQLLQNSDRVLLAISDSALRDFYLRYLAGLDKKIVHFSGALDLTDLEMIGAHPLMTFGGPLRNLSFYDQIHFTVDSKVSVAELLPGLSNSWSHINPKDKALYHSLCVLGGNLFFALTQELKGPIEKLGIPKESFENYLQQSIHNSVQQGWQAWSGPLARKDLGTQQKNIEALEGLELRKVYQFFQKFYSERNLQ